MSETDLAVLRYLAECSGINAPTIADIKRHTGSDEHTIYRMWDDRLIAREWTKPRSPRKFLITDKGRKALKVAA